VVAVSIAGWGMWGGFLLFVLALLALDLGVFHRKAHEVSLKEAGIWSVVWVVLAMSFGGGIYFFFGSQKALEFATGYVIEKALSVDNIFVFVVIFGYFSIPKKFQHRVLFWGILGALLMRGGFIIVGGALVAKFHWVMYLFGALLLATGVKMMFQKNEHLDPGKNPVMKIFQRFVPTTPNLSEDRFFVGRGATLKATPLFVALLALEMTDLIFAVDSIPAIFAITQDSFIVFTSNMFAILGLRSLYFLLAGIVDRFVYLKTGLALVLVFIGSKMLVAGFFKISTGGSLAVITVLIGGSVVLSLLKTRSVPSIDFSR